MDAKRLQEAEANNVRVQPADMDSQALGQYVADQTMGVLHRLDDLRPFYEELWKRFGELKKNEKILGCRTRTEYARKILGKSMRSIQYALYGRRTLEDNVPLQFIEDEEEQAEKEFKEAEKDEARKREQRYQKLKPKPEKDLSEEDLDFIHDYEADRDHERYNRLTRGKWNHREPKENLNADDLKFVQDYQEKLRKQKEQWEEQAAKARARNPEFYRAFDSAFSTVRIKQPPAKDLKEFASLGRREAARRYHPDRGDSTGRMAQLNQVAGWLEKLAGEV